MQCVLCPAADRQPDDAGEDAGDGGALCPQAEHPVHAQQEPVQRRVLPVHEETHPVQPALRSAPPQPGSAGTAPLCPALLLSPKDILSYLCTLLHVLVVRVYMGVDICVLWQAVVKALQSVVIVLGDFATTLSGV